MWSARRPAHGSLRRQRLLRAARAGSWLAACAVAHAAESGCEPRATGVDDCRELEHARCDAAAQCGDITDVDACKRFYRDHCAHGLPLEEEPAGSDVEACRLAIVAAGECAEEQGSTIEAASCADPDLSAGSDPRVSLACDVVHHPELVPACAFLTPDEGEPDGSAGAAGAAPGPAAGESGVAGAESARAGAGAGGDATRAAGAPG
jgi:hypothetical protein